jgi:hypothetical protein
VLENHAGFIQHEGKRIYVVDCEGLSPEQVLELIPIVARDVRAEPRGSVLSLCHVKNVPVDRRLYERVAEMAAANAPYIKATAISGTSSVQRAFVALVKVFSRREFHVFDTMEEAKAFLVSLP